MGLASFASNYCSFAGLMLWQDGSAAREAEAGIAMVKRKKKKRFSKVEAVKALARQRIGPVPPSRVVPDKREKRKERDEKHPETLQKLLEDE
jgi:hypothetical protein